jgi:hypothetical protein
MMRGWLKLLRLFRLFQRRTKTMFPATSFAIVLDFVKGSRPWSGEVFDGTLDLVKWCYHAISGQTSLVGSELETNDPVVALEQLGESAQNGVATFNPALVVFVAQFLLGIILEKWKKG